ncbi:hypothetical protein GCM10010191_77860 [Actinomadura vinacea]|uniref:SnoaL-like domain-containing protein n=1 Tax=Actinomadura vinacea TaxID=115336 RepID=A0ABN3K7B5_9ACTN
MQGSDLHARLTRLEELERARGFFHTYAATLDRPDPEAAAALFAADGVLRTPRGTYRGRTEIAGFFTAVLDRDRATKRHFIVNPEAAWLEPGLVRIRSYFLFTGRGADRSLIGWGRYGDTVDLSGDVPLFREKTIEPEIASDLATGWALDETGGPEEERAR